MTEYINLIVFMIIFLPIVILIRNHPLSIIRKLCSLFIILLTIAIFLFVPIKVFIEYKLWAVMLILTPLLLRCIDSIVVIIVNSNFKNLIPFTRVIDGSLYALPAFLIVNHYESRFAIASALIMFIVYLHGIDKKQNEV